MDTSLYKLFDRDAGRGYCQIDVGLTSNEMGYVRSIMSMNATLYVVTAVQLECS